MNRIPRIPPAEARQKTKSGEALLVCAYRDDAKFTKYHLEGAIPLSTFKERADNLPDDKEIIFYCD